MGAHVLFSRHDGIGLVTLNRPETLNAFADGMRDELGGILHEAVHDDAVRAVVVTGAGRAFCAGADIERMHDLVDREEWDALEGFVEAGASVVRLIDTLGKPVLAAINGVAAGGGANLALACDIRVAATTASIGQTFCRLGLQPDWGGTYFLPRLVGLGHAMELVLTAEMVTADEALRLGLFNRVVAADRVVDETLDLAGRIAAWSPQAVAMAKHAMRQSSGLSLAESLEMERTHQLRLFRTPEAREAMRAFLAKRRRGSGTHA